MDHGLITYPTYTLKDDTAYVQLYGRLENGETFRADIPYKPYFFIRAQDVERAKSVTALDTNHTDLTTLEGDPVVLIELNNPRDVPSIRGDLMDAGIPCYEADIRFAYRYLIDKGLTGDIALRGTYEKGTRIDRVYTDPDVFPGDWHGTLTTLSIDIETDKDAANLWSVSLAMNDHVETHLVGKEAKNATTHNDEASLLTTLNNRIRELDPDIITGWNVIDFDLKVLRELYDTHDIPWDWARDNRSCGLRLYTDYLRDSSADIPGRMVLDGIQLLRTSFIKLDSYTLEAAAQHYLGTGKLFTGKNRHAQISDAYTNDPEALVEYNQKDTTLVLDILRESGALTLTIERSRITGMQLDRVRASIASLDMLYLPRLRGRKCVAPTAGYTDKEERITGGYVMTSKPGIYDYVIVVDFKSLYPSIIRTLNIDPWSYEPTKKLAESNKEYLVTEDGTVFKQALGILPQILQELWEQRDAARTKGDELARYAIKILMNSFFGVLASPNCRFFSMDMANAITKTGQHVIKLAAERMKEAGYSVIYGDTDSLFLNLDVRSEEEAEHKGREIEQEVNEYLKKYVEQQYLTKSFLELEYEKTFIKFLMPKTRGGEGSKKRYAGLIKKNGEEKVDFVGLEFVRRDWTDLSKEFQLGILDRIFHDEDPQLFIKEFVDDLRTGKHDDLLVYRKALRKPVDQYTKTTPPHVKAARLLETIESNLIEYVMTVDGPEPVQNQQHTIDYEHYVDKQLEPIANAILGFYDTNFDDVLRGTSQKGLFEF